MLHQHNIFTLTWQMLSQSVQRGIVGHEAGSEDKGLLLLMHLSQLGLKCLVQHSISGDVARPSSAGSIALQGLPGTSHHARVARQAYIKQNSKIKEIYFCS